MMKKVYLLANDDGIVFRCMYAGLDNENHPIWINLTPGYNADDVRSEMMKTRLNSLIFLSFEHEVVGSDVVAFVLARTLERSPMKSEITHFTLREMKLMGMKWNKEPLEISFAVIDSGNEYIIYFTDKESIFLDDIDVEGFENINEVYIGLQHFVLALTEDAGIPVRTTLITDNKTVDSLGKSRLDLFDEVVISI